MQATEDELILCHAMLVDAVAKDHLSAVVVIEQQLNFLLGTIAKRRRQARATPRE